MRNAKVVDCRRLEGHWGSFDAYKVMREAAHSYLLADCMEVLGDVRNFAVVRRAVVVMAEDNNYCNLVVGHMAAHDSEVEIGSHPFGNFGSIRLLPSRIVYWLKWKTKRKFQEIRVIMQCLNLKSRMEFCIPHHLYVTCL